MKPAFVVGGAAVALAVVAVARLRMVPTAAPEAEAAQQQCCREAAPLESAGLCPWRQPEKDRLALFPQSDRAEQRLLALSDLRPQILSRLGKGGVIDGNALYVYQIFRGDEKVGVVLVQRAPGQYGAVEYVVGLTPDGRVAGVRVQSQRETPEVARAITAPAWLQSFRGKTADAPFVVGGDLPVVPAAARQTADSLAASVRRLIVEATVGVAHGRA